MLAYVTQACFKSGNVTVGFYAGITGLEKCLGISLCIIRSLAQKMPRQVNMKSRT